VTRSRTYEKVETTSLILRQGTAGRGILKEGEGCMNGTETSFLLYQTFAVDSSYRALRKAGGTTVGEGRVAA